MIATVGRKRHTRMTGRPEHVGPGWAVGESRFDFAMTHDYEPDGHCHFGDPCPAPAVPGKRFCPDHLELLHRIRDELEAEEADIRSTGGVMTHAIIRQHDRLAGGWVDH